MASNENLFHKLLGLPEDVTEPTYFELLEVEEGDVVGPQVEEKYKAQIQKVQRYTNNPKYKEAALFLKGELRKARSALVDEGRRAAYMRDLLHARTQSIRGSVKPLLIKGYVLSEEYKFLSGEAAKVRVPETVVQQVLKQELEKLGIDPTTALVDDDGGGAGVGRSKSVVASQSKRKKGGPMTLTARFPWMRYIFEPSELFTMDTLMAIVTFPLWLVGAKKSAPRPGQPLSGGLVFHSPFVASLLLMLGVGAMVIPYSDTDMLAHKADNVYLQEKVAELETQRQELYDANQELEQRVAKLKADGGGTGTNGAGGASSAEVEKLEAELAKVTAERDAALEGLEEANDALGQAQAELKGARATVQSLSKALENTGARDSAKLQAELEAANTTLEQQKAAMAKLASENKDLRKQIDEAAGDEKGAAARAKRLDEQMREMARLLMRRRRELDPGQWLRHGQVIGAGNGMNCTIRFARLDGVREGAKMTMVRVVSVGEVELGQVRAGKDTVGGVLTRPTMGAKPRAGDIVWRLEEPESK